jgi:hypothetical protein
MPGHPDSSSTLGRSALETPSEGRSPGGGSGWGLSSSGLGMAFVLRDVRLTRVDLVCSDELLGRIDWGAARRLGAGER